MIIDGISTDIAVNLSVKKVTIKERWKYEPLNFATPSSTNEISPISVDIYPNPAFDVLNIKIKALGAVTNLSVHIINTDGKVMSEISIKNEGNSLDISALNSGVYTVKIMEQNQIIFVSKFIKIQ